MAGPPPPPVRAVAPAEHRLVGHAFSLEVVEQDAGPRPFGKADPVLALVVQVMLVDGEEGQVGLAPDQPLPGGKPQQLLEARRKKNDDAAPRRTVLDLEGVRM